MREWTIVSGMEEARACCVCLAWASFGLRDVHVKTNGCFFSLSVQHDCCPRLHVCISCRSQRKHSRHIASVRDMLHIESSRRFRRVNTCGAHMRIRGACLGRSCACKIGPSFSTCMPIFSLYVAAKMLHMSKFGRRFRHACLSSDASSGMHTSIWCHYVLFLRSDV